MNSLVIEVHALGLEDDAEIFFADVGEANEHAVPTVQRLDHVMFTEDDVVKNCAVWREIIRFDCISVDWLVRWAEVESLMHRTLTQEQFAEITVIIIELLAVSGV